MNIKGIIIAIILGILIFGAGFGASMLYKNPSSTTLTQNQMQGQQQLSETIKELSSRVIPSIAAYGTVTNIDGRNISLRYQGDSIVISVMPDAKIYSYTPSATGSNAKSLTTQVDFSKIKVGDNLSVNLKVIPTGQIEGLSVIVLPPVVTTTTPSPTPTPTKTPIKKY
jgi:hypothetical protein